MKDRPILFSAPMVRALLAGRKTQTRRVLTKARTFATPDARPFTLKGTELTRALQNASDFRSLGEDCWTWTADAFDYQAPAVRTHWNARLPYAAGDRLWVRESSADVHPIAVQQDRFNIKGKGGIPGPPGVTYRRVYRADGDVLQVWHSSKGYPYRSLEPEDELATRHPIVCSEWVGRLKYQPWEPGIHMPRWASRLTLIVSEVRVERLQDISRDDAIAEGLVKLETAKDIAKTLGCDWSFEGDTRHGSPVSAYASLWDHINGPGAWDANPWVVALSFTVLQQNIDQEANRG